MKELFSCTLKLLPQVIVFGPGRFLERYVVLLNASILLRHAACLQATEQ
jgi:hypothetical protein